MNPEVFPSRHACEKKNIPHAHGRHQSRQGGQERIEHAGEGAFEVEREAEPGEAGLTIAMPAGGGGGA